jgi:hypothetical protein
MPQAAATRFQTEQQSSYNADLSEQWMPKDMKFLHPQCKFLQNGRMRAKGAAGREDLGGSHFRTPRNAVIAGQA